MSYKRQTTNAEIKTVGKLTGLLLDADPDVYARLLTQYKKNVAATHDGQVKKYRSLQIKVLKKIIESKKLIEEAIITRQTLD